MKLICEISMKLIADSEIVKFPFHTCKLKVRFDSFRILRFESIAFGIEGSTRDSIRNSIPSIKNLDSISDSTGSFLAFMIQSTIRSGINW